MNFNFVPFFSAFHHLDVRELVRGPMNAFAPQVLTESTALCNNVSVYSLFKFRKGG